MIRALIFDLDGTLVNSLPGIANALNLALADFDLSPLQEAEVEALIGKGALSLAERALPASHREHGPALLEKFLSHYRETWRSGTHLFPGILQALLDLQQQGYHMAVLSNKMHHGTVEIVNELFPKDLFHPVYGQREGIPQKPDPGVALEIIASWNLTPAEVAYVGDSSVDLATAQNAGMIPLIFDWGYGTPNTIPLLSSAADLTQAVSEGSRASSH